MTRRHWVNTISLEHALLGVSGGFTQADHGRDTRLRALGRGDGLVFYSPRTAIRSGDPVQQFTALGEIEDDEPFRVDLEPAAGEPAPPLIRPWRRRVAFERVERVAIRPLLEDLSFVSDKRHWGMPFRRGLLEVPAADFEVIAHAMRAAGPQG